MIHIKKFVFNPFQTNTYLLYDETGECVIVDASCEDDYEKKMLSDFITRNDLKPVRLIYTHCHVDHILGNNYITETYGLQPEVHPEGEVIWNVARESSTIFNVHFDGPFEPGKFLNDGDTVTFGKSRLKVLYTPGHASGSICLWNEEQKFVIAGDVLFYGSIGRTDLPTGNFEVLAGSIKNKLFTLDDETTVYPGHGPETTIGYEKNNNPYVYVF